MSERVSAPSDQQRSVRPRISSTLAVFLALVLVASATLDILLIRAGGLRHAKGLVLAIMWVPALAAVASLLLTRRSLAAIGWRMGPIRILGAAILLPAVIVTPVYALLWAGGFASLDVREWSVLVQENFGCHLSAAPSVLVIASIGLLADSIAAAGEEIGWRGLLLPELGRSLSLPLAALTTGVIWAAWHYPGILFGGYASAGTPLGYSLVSFTIMALGWALVLAWLRFASGSVWPAALMHGAHNIVIQAVLDPVTRDVSGLTPYVSGEFGLGVACTYAVAGGFAWRALARMPRAAPLSS
jgi:membrane protease YdiL (CAAX protease family)